MMKRKMTLFEYGKRTRKDGQRRKRNRRRKKRIENEDTDEENESRRVDSGETESNFLERLRESLKNDPTVRHDIDFEKKNEKKESIDVVEETPVDLSADSSSEEENDEDKETIVVDDPFPNTAFAKRRDGLNESELRTLRVAQRRFDSLDGKEAAALVTMNEYEASRREKRGRPREDIAFKSTASVVDGEKTRFPAPVDLVAGSYGVRESVVKRWDRKRLTGLQRVLLPAVTSMKDVVMLNRSTETDRVEIRELYAAHCLNHVLRTRAIVRRNETFLKEQRMHNDDDDDEDEAQTKPPKRYLRDQGFTRPRVLVLVPFRSDALDVIERILQLLPPRYKVHNRAKLQDEYGDASDDESEESRPEWRRVFSGNTDDCFRIGLQISTSSARLFTDFYHSDILVASPLGLRLATGTEEDREAQRGRVGDVDFLSSVEIAVIDCAGSLHMQNWENVEIALNNLNRIPKTLRDMDISRIYAWALEEGQSSHYRQTLMFSAFPTADMRAAVRTHCRSANGLVSLKRKANGVLERLRASVRQVFQRLPTDASNEIRTISDAREQRFAYFEKRYATLLRGSSSHVLVFVDSFFDFVRLRAFLRDRLESDELCALSSDMTDADIARARTDFYHGRRRVMLLSGRFHYFRRYRIRGVRHLVFFSPPSVPGFYCDFVNALDNQDRTNDDDRVTKTSEHSVLLLFDAFDSLKLLGIVGRKRASKISKGSKSAYLFV